MTGHEFVVDGVIEGRPELNVDWNAQYAKQRKERLADSINEYLGDSDVPISVFYDDVRDIVEELVSYHETQKEKAASVLHLFCLDKHV